MISYVCDRLVNMVLERVVSESEQDHLVTRLIVTNKKKTQISRFIYMIKSICRVQIWEIPSLPSEVQV